MTRRILEVIRAWGGNEAVAAAKAGDADSVARAVEKRQIEGQDTLSPRSRRTLFRYTDVAQRLRTRTRLSRDRQDDSLNHARARIQVSDFFWIFLLGVVFLSNMVKRSGVFIVSRTAWSKMMRLLLCLSH